MRTWQIVGWLTIVGLGSWLTVVAGQQRPVLSPEQEARLQIREIMNGLYVIPGFDGGQSGGNVAVRVTGHGVIIVDDKFPYSFEFITQQVRSVTDQPIKYVLNTHHPGAHAGSQTAGRRRDGGHGQPARDYPLASLVSRDAAAARPDPRESDAI